MVISCLGLAEARLVIVALPGLFYQLLNTCGEPGGHFLCMNDYKAELKQNNKIFIGKLCLQWNYNSLTPYRIWTVVYCREPLLICNRMPVNN